MLQIEPIEQIVTKRSVVLTLDEDEIAKVLVDPRGLQKQLRQVKHQWSGNGKAPAQKDAVKRGKAVSQRGGLKCQWCHKPFKFEVWKAAHEAKCDQRDIGTVSVGE